MAGAAGICLLLSLTRLTVAQDASRTFTNPLKDSGADPWVFAWDGNYYYMNTTGKNLTLWKTRDITDLANAEKKVVWSPEPGKDWSKDLWAPELHRWGSKWYIYFAAGAGSGESRRIYVVENSSADPMQGEWTLKGKVADTTNHWAIDPDLFEANGVHYLLWSGWKGDVNGEQDIFIARMSNPWAIDSPRTVISAPTYAWEKDGNVNGGTVHVNEGPEAIIHDGKVYVVYSASGCWTDSYSLGAIVAAANANLLDAASWKKADHPFLQTDAKAGAFGPGHNAFFKSPDGKQDWIIYHANPGPHQGCGAQRSPRIQPFTWTADGPDFGSPVPVGKALKKPSNTAGN
jgi:GH43 family beta-xylosidase